MRIAAVVLFVFLLLPAAALASSSGVAVARVYVYEPPQVAVSLARSSGTLICSWDITDGDENDTFGADVVWSKNGETVLTEHVDCGTLKHCAALYRPEPQMNEAWDCSVSVRDGFDAVGSGSARFQLTPLGFFDSILRGLLGLFNLA